MMLELLFMEQWSPYMAGICIGVLSWFAFLLSDKPIGCSTAFTRTSGMIERLFRGSKVNEKPYYKEFTPTVDWEWMLVLGVVIGAFISSSLSGVFQLQWVPSTWAATFGNSLSLRLLVALIGGILLGFGARWAGGCTSGHGISGTLQLAVSSWIAFICFFAGGLAAAFFIFNILGG
ncbi:MAG: YeeE/YedE thiosulfate transporter family protein [Methanocellales archaeon]|nr:YeeE/YedE thiosulfate transporter family protein [Methanocellales archaeon]MDD3420904.1 YeeE/YedE thiosulfate transporter family protein [Methanocellales archaeon]MDD4898298.1 YeeE/YedE thiosulfate transporter family protein [Methanocellales archaeon]MDD5447202.1 YeeE/YedE thiosulfate transporter family protein [Methanocellales archaeon]